MSKKLLKNLIFVTVIAILCFAVAVTASATDESDFTYTISNEMEGVIITGYVGDGGDVVIPDYLGGYPVIAIGDTAFSTTTSDENDQAMQTPAYAITSIIIPNSVVSIGEGAFHRAAFDNWYGSAFGFKKVSDLTVVLGSGVENISASAFWCSYISNSGEEGRVKINILFPGTEDEWKELDCSAEYFEDMSDGLDIYAASYNDMNVVTFNSCTYSGSYGIHNFYDWNIESDATDMNDGLRIGYCWCGATCEEIIHKWYSDETFSCTSETFTYYCYNCDAEKTEPNANVAEHDWYTYDDTTPGYADKTITYYCWYCDEYKTEVILGTCTHEWQVIKEGFNCEEGGELSYVCYNCDSYKTETVAPKAHEMKAYPDPSTFCGEREFEVSCKYCDYYEYVIVKGTGNNHSLAVFDELPETCTEDGWIDWACEREGCDYKEHEVVPALGHNCNDKWTALTEATCSQSGISVRACKRCAEIESQFESAYGHYDNDFNGKCDECSVVLENSGTMIPDDATPDTPDEPEQPKEEANIFSFLTHFLTSLLDFFSKLFKLN